MMVKDFTNNYIAFYDEFIKFNSSFCFKINDTIQFLLSVPCCQWLLKQVN